MLCKNVGMEEETGYVELIYMGEERMAIEFLQQDPYRNIWTIASLKRYGAFNLGLPEQGSFYGCFDMSGRLQGLLYCNNLGFWRFHAGSGEDLSALLGAAVEDGRKPVSITGDPEVLWKALEIKTWLELVEESEREVIYVLRRESFKPASEGKARFASAGDLEEMVELEKGLQVHLLGRAADSSFLRQRILEVVEKGRAAVYPDGDGLAAKAELEVEIDGLSQLSGVFTHPPVRHRGAGRAVCRLLCALALSEGREVCLETQEENQLALALYSGLGFVRHAGSLVARLAEN